MTILRLPSWLRPEIQKYLLEGPAAIKKDLRFSYDYCDIIDEDISAYTKDQMTEVQKSILNPKLAARVTYTLDGFTVDTIRTIKFKSALRQTHALLAWTPLNNYFRNATVISSSFVAVCTVLSFRRIPVVFILAAAAGAVAGAVLTGILVARYLAAKKQVEAWTNPGHHLALQRTAAYGKSFPEILTLKSYEFGGLLVEEIRPHYIEHLKAVAQLLTINPSTPEKQYEWLGQFFNGIPHPLDPQILKELYGNRFQAVGTAFDQLERLDVVIMSKRLIKIVKAMGQLENEHYPKIKEFTPRLFHSIVSHYQQQMAQLKQTVLQNPVFLQNVTTAARTLLQQACEIIVESKQGITLAEIPGPRPAEFNPISDNCYPVEPPESEYGKFIAEVRRRAT